MEYLKKLFTSQDSPQSKAKEVINDVLKPVVSDELNQVLIRDPSAEEIKEAMFSIHPDKAPGLMETLPLFAVQLECSWR